MKKVGDCAATIFGLAALARASTAPADDTIVTKAPPKPAAPPAPAA